MCGIAGIICSDQLDQSERTVLGPMLARLAHRGPDDAGQHITDRAALGHRRLSIIDLHTGRQPLANEAGTVWAVINGEVYNFLELREDLISRGHVFRTTSDSEVLVHLYEERGDRCVEMLSGMFAFALWDEPNKLLLLARDRLGVKPLYYCFDDRRLIFASELKSILAAPRVAAEVDPTSLIDYLTYGFIPSPKTIFKDVWKLPPGHILAFQNGRVRMRCYWNLRYSGWAEGGIDEISDQLWDEVRRATRPRLIADVPVGAFLSGGLDSSAVVAAMTQVAGNRVVTVTCGFDERHFDERDLAREVARRLQTDHHETLVRPDAARIAETLVWHFDEPFADASAIPTYYLSQQTRRFVKVVLSGDGGDEALAGYRRYRFDGYEQAVRCCLPGFLRRVAFGPLARVYPSRPWMPRPLRAQATLRNLAVDGPTAHGQSVATLQPPEVQLLLADDVARAVRGYDPLDHVRAAYRRCDAPDHLSKCQYVDIKLGLGDGILTKVDRASMAHGLEVRSPMLDYRFVEFAWTIPPKLRIRGAAGKHPLRHALRRHLGEALAARRKAGFEAPLDEWFAGPLRERFRDELLQSDAPLHDWIPSAAIERIWHEHLSRRQLCGPTLWKLVILNAWCEKFLRAERPRREGEAPAEPTASARLLAVGPSPARQPCTP